MIIFERISYVEIITQSRNKIFDKVFPTVVGGVLMLTGAGTGFADASSAADLVTTSLGLATDVGLEVADFVTDKV